MSEGVIEGFPPDESLSEIVGSVLFEECFPLYNKLVCGDRDAWNRVQFLANTRQDPLAQALSAMLLVGNTFSPNLELSHQYATRCLPWLLQQTDGCCYYCLGSFYFEGMGATVDKEKAGMYYKLGADNFNNALCQCGYGYYLEKEKDDFEGALEWYKLSAKGGYIRAQFNIASCYLEGDGVPKDMKESLKWCRLAAEQGFPEALYQMGYGYYEATEAITGQDEWFCDYIESFYWWSLAAERGHGEAQSFLGYLYDLGKGTARDEVQAAVWYGRAADKGDEFAQYKLGVFHEYGKGGMSADLGLACKYYRLSSDQGRTVATRALERLESALDGSSS